MRSFDFYATVIPGLEEVALDELQEKLGAIDRVRLERKGRWGRIFFRYQRTPRRLLQIRAPLQCFALVGEIRGITVGKPGLEHLVRQLGRFNLESVCRLAKACEPDVDVSRFQLTATVQGTHRFSRSQLSVRAQEVMRQEHGLVHGQGKKQLRLHLQVEGRRALLGLRLGEPLAESPVQKGLGGTLAYCMARLLAIEANDTIVDPYCATAGAEPIRLASEPRRWLGFRPALSQIGSLESSGAKVVGSGIGLPLAEGSAQAVLSSGWVADPQVRAGQQGAWLREVARILQVGGVAALVVDIPQVFVAQLETNKLPLMILARLPIHINGRALYILALERVEEEQFLQIELGG